MGVCSFSNFRLFSIKHMRYCIAIWCIDFMDFLKKINFY
jgi:hypothetical protein